MREGEPLVRDQRGVAFLEFLVAFIPIWVFFLSLVQLCMISTARLIVKHAADSAARAAVVVLPDDPSKYQGPEDMLEDIRRAALAPLTPLAPSWPGSRPTVRSAIDSASPLSTLYSDAALSLSFPAVSEGPAGTEITVRVSYAYACQVPIARRILCSGSFGLSARRERGKELGSLVKRFPGNQFLLLRQETTLLLHAAAYEYEPAGERS